MTPQQFITHFREAFGEATPLPIAIWYDDTAVATDCRVPRCMIGAIRKVCEGNTLTLCEETVQCGGWKIRSCFKSGENSCVRNET